MKKLKIFEGFGAFSLTAAVLLAVFFANGLFPFGWGTVAWCDMNQQLIPLFCDFKDILAGEKSLFLNLANAGGMNFYGVFFFFLSSPFTFLVAFVEKADIPFLMNALIIVKLSIAGFTAAFALKRICENLHFGTTVALGTAYALCGYGMLFYQNIMWLDMMYLFPLVVLGCYRLIEENRNLLLTVTLTISIIFNFYIAFMVFLFVIFFFGIFALFYRNTNRRLYVNLGISGAVSLLASAIVWLPCLLQYTSSARGNSFLEELKQAQFFAPYETTLTVLLCSGIIFSVLILLLPKLNTCQKETKFLGIVFALTALPLIIEPVNIMWHTGSYMSFPARYGFITVFIGLVIAAKEISRLGVTNKSRPLSYSVLILVGLILAFAVLFTLNNTEILSAYVGRLWGNNASLKGELFLCSLFVVAYILIVILAKRGVLATRAAAFALCILVAVEGGCSAQIFMASGRDRLSLYNYQSVISLRDEAKKEGFYRLNTEDKITDANMTGAAGFNSLSHYTSLNDQTYMETAKKLGYSGYWMETGNWGGSILSDALLSVGYTAHRKNGEYSITENPYFLNLGIKCQGEIPQELGDGDRLSILGNAFALMTNSKNPVIKYNYTSLKNCSYFSDNKGYRINNLSAVGEISFVINVTEAQTLYFDAYNGFSTRLTEDINNSFGIYVNGIEICSAYPTQSKNGLVNLGSYKNRTVDITIELYKTCDLASFGVFGIKEDILKSYINSAEALSLTANGREISGEAQKGTYFISLPYKTDYRITLNGEKIEYFKALGGFIGVTLSTEGRLKITFVPKGFYMGLVISLLGLILLILMVCFRKKNFVYGEKLKNIVYGVFLGGWITALLSVYIMPIIVNLSDFKI